MATACASSVEIAAADAMEAVDLIYTHVHRMNQTAVAEEMQQKQMTVSDFFRQFECRPAGQERETMRECCGQTSNDRQSVSLHE